MKPDRLKKLERGTFAKFCAYFSCLMRAGILRLSYVLGADRQKLTVSGCNSLEFKNSLFPS